MYSGLRPRLKTHERAVLAIVLALLGSIAAAASVIPATASRFMPDAAGPAASRIGEGNKPATGSRQQQDEDRPIRLKSDLVLVPAAVSSSAGRPIKSLTKDDFVVYENGKRQIITDFAAVEDPVNLMLLLDISGSTHDEIELMKQAANNFLAELKPNDHIGVIVFAGEVELIADFFARRQKVVAAITAISTPKGKDGQHFSTNTGTSFYDALYLAVTENPLKGAKGRKAIICMSDGVDSTSKTKYAEVGKLVENSEASVYFLKLNTEEATLEGLMKAPADPGYINLSKSQVDRYYDEYDPKSFDRNLPRKSLSPLKRKEINEGLYKIAQREVGQLAEHTGGRVFPVNKLEDLAGVYKQLADDLHSQYSIGYYSTNTASDGKWRAIKVEVKKLRATVRARSGYWAPEK
jgi:VWFA-related protein